MRSYRSGVESTGALLDLVLMAPLEAQRLTQFAIRNCVADATNYIAVSNLLENNDLRFSKGMRANISISLSAIRYRYNQVRISDTASQSMICRGMPTRKKSENR